MISEGEGEGGARESMDYPGKGMQAIIFGIKVEFRLMKRSLVPLLLLMCHEGWLWSTATFFVPVPPKFGWFCLYLCPSRPSSLHASS